MQSSTIPLHQRFSNSLVVQEPWKVLVGTWQQRYHYNCVTSGHIIDLGGLTTPYPSDQEGWEYLRALLHGSLCIRNVWGGNYRNPLLGCNRKTRSESQSLKKQHV